MLSGHHRQQTTWGMTADGGGQRDQRSEVVHLSRLRWSRLLRTSQAGLDGCRSSDFHIEVFRLRRHLGRTQSRLACARSRFSRI